MNTSCDTQVELNGGTSFIGASKLFDAKSQIFTLLTNKLDGKLPFGVTERKTCFGDHYLMIWVSCSTKEINNVSGQMPQMVSLSLNEKMEFHPQVFGGMGGQCIYRKINPAIENEKYYAMKSIKVPFRTPKNELPLVIKALASFIDNYLKLLRDNKDVLMHQDLVNYSEILG